MEEKEFNKMILAELRRIAVEVYNDMIIKDGIYTAAELANNKDCTGNYIAWELHGLKGKQYTVHIGSFSCSFKAEQVFYFVWKFETLCRIRQETKIKFRFGNPNEIPVNEKAMYLNKGNRVITKKKKLIKYNDVVAVDAKRKENVYFYSRGIWHYLANISSGKDNILHMVTKENVKNELKKWDYTGGRRAITPIYEALRDSLGINSEMKTENIPAVYATSEAEQASHIETAVCKVPDEQPRISKPSGRPNDRATSFGYIRLAAGLYILCAHERVKRETELPTNTVHRILDKSMETDISRHETSVLPRPEPGKQLSGACKWLHEPDGIRIRDGT